VPPLSDRLREDLVAAIEHLLAAKVQEGAAVDAPEAGVAAAPPQGCASRSAVSSSAELKQDVWQPFAQGGGRLFDFPEAKSLHYAEGLATTATAPPVWLQMPPGLPTEVGVPHALDVHNFPAAQLDYRPNSHSLSKLRLATSPSTATPPLSAGSSSADESPPIHQADTSVEHAAGTCKPCIYQHAGGCRKAGCLFCHLPHNQQQLRRVRPSKCTRRCLQRRTVNFDGKTTAEEVAQPIVA